MEMLIIAIVVVIAFAGVLYPLMRRRPGAMDDREFAMDDPPRQFAPAGIGNPAVPVAPGDGEADPVVAEDDLEREVLRYRTAVRAGTVCRKCGQANPADSAFCFECGAPLPRADAKEFE
jgi:hypothetical protein